MDHALFAETADCLRYYCHSLVQLCTLLIQKRKVENTPLCCYVTQGLQDYTCVCVAYVRYYEIMHFKAQWVNFDHPEE